MQTFNHNYPSDITREQFKIIRVDLESAKKRTKPRNIDLYSVFCAILYIIKGGIQWDMIPSDLPKRWVVDRTFGWLDKARRLWKNCEKMLHNSLQITVFALLAVLIKRF